MQDEKIRRRILSRKEEAIAQVMSQYAKTMWHVACAVLHDTGSPQDAEECVADAFLYLWEHADKFDPARGSLKTFLCVVTRSRAMDRRRKLLRQQQREPRDADPGQKQRSFHSILQTGHLPHCMHSLSRKYPFVKHFLSNYDN